MCFVTAIWCHWAMGPNTTCSTYNGNTTCYLNKTTQTHVNIYTHRLKQTKKANFGWLFSFIGPQSSGDVYILVVSRSSPYPLEICIPGSLTERVCLCIHVSLWVKLLAPLIPGRFMDLISSLVWAGDECGWPQLPSTPHPAGRREPQWQVEVSAEHCAFEWHVSLILLRANVIAFRIIFIFEKRWDNHALKRYWRSLEMRSIFPHKNSREWHTQINSRMCEQELHVHTHTYVHWHTHKVLFFTSTPLSLQTHTCRFIRTLHGL